MKRKCSVVIILSILFMVFGILGWGSVRNQQRITPLKEMTKQELSTKIKDYYNVTPYRTGQMYGKKGIDRSAQGLTKSIIDWENNVGVNELEDLDETFSQFILDENITRYEKITTLWQVAEQLEGQSKYFVLDYLEMLEPVELVPDVINTFGGSSNTELKGKLIRLMSTSLGIANPETQADDQLKFIAEASIQVSNLLKEELTNNSDEGLLNQALWYYPAVAPQGEAVSVLKNLMAENKGTKAENIMNAWAAVAFSDSEVQTDYVPELLSELNNQPEHVRNTMLRYLFPYLQEGNISPDVKDELLTYLEQSEPTYDPSVNSSYFEWLESRFNWFDSYAKIKTDSVTEKNEFIVNTLINSSDPTFQANLIIYVPTDVINNLKDNDRNCLVTGFRSQYSDNLPDDEKRLFANALAVLKE